MGASVVFAGLGAAVAARAAQRGEPRSIWLPVGYFAVMEALQAAGYAVVDRCTDPVNQTVTVLSFLHIAFQPFFINAYALTFLPKTVSDRLAMPVFALCAVSAAVMLLQLYPFEWAGACAETRPLCGPLPCTVSGEWHIGWQLPLNGLGNELQGMRFVRDGFPSYVVIGMMLPFAYGSWPFAILLFVLGPGLAQMLTSDHNEWPAVWCLFSIAMLLLTLVPPVRERLRVASWPLWPRRWQSDHPAPTAVRT